MLDKHLHIISFNVPYPPNYGGVIDVFYKLKALHREGVKIHLHCFKYDRATSEKLLKYCITVNYYDRKTGFLSAVSTKPYIVSSRRSEELITNLLKDNHPILFEGLHSCYYIDDKRLQSRKKIYRESNIEHLYYYNLFKVEKKITSKLYFLSASFKLKIYEKILRHASLMLVVSQKDTEYLQSRFPAGDIRFLPSFHANTEVSSLNGIGNYALYHGNLTVAENDKAAHYLIEEVFNDIDTKLIIAGLSPQEHLKRLAGNYPNVKIVVTPTDEEMFNLIKNAQVNILVTFQATGLKLKLLNTLYNGRFTLVNTQMLNGTRLNDLCVIADGKQEFKKALDDLSKKKFTKENIKLRKETLNRFYSNETNAKKLIEYVF
ncbi:MAG: glycosyltransferase family 1 protein [Bacteroidales bacterium]|nr:glycosyltransferase family 1 protein [Bacteroidales bacterium]